MPSTPLIRSGFDSFPKPEDPATTESVVPKPADCPMENPSSAPVRSLDLDLDLDLYLLRALSNDQVSRQTRR
jgi:hypothetical protein